eukprot:PhM_4_TR1579/c0_g1_i1/m.98139/K12833/SF3B14; pre-mRNA branch site protein p14
MSTTAPEAPSAQVTAAAMAVWRKRVSARLGPEVNRLLYVRNLPFKINAEALYELFGRFGAIHNIWLGDRRGTRGSAYVLYEDIYDAMAAVDQLSNFHIGDRYLVVLYYSKERTEKVEEGKRKRRDVEEHQMETFAAEK